MVRILVPGRPDRPQRGDYLPVMRQEVFLDARRGDNLAGNESKHVIFPDDSHDDRAFCCHAVSVVVVEMER